MKLKTVVDISVVLNQTCAPLDGFSAGDGADLAGKVQLCCAPYAAVYTEFSAIPIQAIITLALQLLPIIFGGGGFTIEKLTAILTLIQSIFTA